MRIETPPFHTLGNRDLLDLYKVAFLCSRNCPATVPASARAWAAAQRASGTCVISGFHSRIEKEVLAELLKGTQPLIVALASGIRKRLDPELQSPLDAGRLLIVTRYAESVTHPWEDSCLQRNRLMMALAEETVIGFVAPGGKLERLVRESPGLNVSILNPPEGGAPQGRTT